MRITHCNLLVIGFCLFATASIARADLVLDSITIKSESPFSGDPVSFNVTVQDPGIEVPYTSGGSTLISNLSVDVNASSIDIIVGNVFGVGFEPFQGLRFSGLDSPGEIISGITVQSSIGGLPGIFNPSAINFGNNFVDVDMQNVVAQNYSAGDRVSIALQFSAVPEPGSFLMVGSALVFAALYRRRTNKRRFGLIK